MIQEALAVDPSDAKAMAMRQRLAKAQADAQVLQTSQDAVLKLLLEGKAALDGGKTDEALRAFNRVLALDPMNGEALDRFRQEILLSRDLGHPNVLRVYHFGECAGRRYVTMRWIDGTTLGDRIRLDGALDPRRAVTITRKIVSALEAAHARRVLHRDIKPQSARIDSGRDLRRDPHLRKPRAGEALSARRAVRPLRRRRSRVRDAHWAPSVPGRLGAGGSRHASECAAAGSVCNQSKGVARAGTRRPPHARERPCEAAAKRGRAEGGAGGSAGRTMTLCPHAIVTGPSPSTERHD